MRALVVMAHGSRREAANGEFREMVDGMRAGLSEIYDRVEAAFLDGVSPSLEEAARQLVAAGAIIVDVYPFFLNQGKHANQDIPALAAALDTEAPGCRVRVLDYFGKSDEIADTCVRHVRQQHG
ncbi:MAG: CbiX/SirB N-terminal domain-containing protein [Verrucomicrobia bacterium]|jgi:sirohydrochlorin ferrochelatase|nr:CbiX/SirB N-terminal domain-containing protein [Verrucomicrobiota bacterium]